MGSNPHMSRLPEWVDFVADKVLACLKVANQIIILSSSEVGQSVLSELEAVLKLKSAFLD